MSDPRLAFVERVFGPVSLVALVVLGSLACTPLSAQNARQADRSGNGMISTAHPLATEAGVRVLEMGGNAADAAVAAGFAIAVVEPTMNSIGGRNQILVRRADGSFHGIDGTTQAPHDYDPDTAPQASYGYAVIGIPGALAGLVKLHREHGSLPIETLLASAIEYAEEGYRLLPGDAARLAGGRDEALEFPGTARVYYRADRSPYRPGDLLRQPEYANTLRAIIEGGDDEFYRGEIARRIVADMQANGGSLTLESLGRYRAEDSRIVRGSYRGYQLVGMDVPAAGVLSIQALQIMERFDPGSMSEAEWFAVTGQALRLASRELRGLGTDTAAARATSKAWAERMAAEVMAPVGAGVDVGGVGRVGGGVAMAGGLPSLPAEGGAPSEWARAGTSNRVRSGTATAPVGARGGEAPSGPLTTGALEDFEGHTTHLSTADGDGMFVSLTQTLGPNMGSKVVTPGLGFLYASTIGGYLGRMEAEERARSNICPFMVLDPAGNVVLVLGAAGGGMIPPAVVHAVTRVIDFGMSLPQALEEPRVAGGSGGLGAETSPDIGWTASELDEMRALGIDVNPVPRDGAFGRVHGIQYDPATRVWIGAADPDWEGTARGPAGRGR